MATSWRVSRPTIFPWSPGAGLLLTPPDTRSNTQRIYVPRQAIQSLEVVSLIGSSRRAAARKLDQPELFAGESDES